MKQKLLLFLMVFLPTVASADAVEIDGIYYKFSFSPVDPEATVSCNPDKYSGDIVIPESVIYFDRTFPVKSIEEKAFYDCNNLTSIRIPHSITHIGRYAFDGCTNLQVVNITDLTSWCNINFEVWGSNPLHYAHQLYLNGEMIKDLVIPETVDRIRKFSFSRCDSLNSITIPESVTTIENEAFYYCSGLTALTIPKSVTSIGVTAFRYCCGLLSVKVENGNIKYDSRNDCNAIIETATNTLAVGCQNTRIPSSVTSIGNSAFYGCLNLSSISIPNSITCIGDESFSDCKSLHTVTIPESVASIGISAFLYGGLTSVVVKREIPLELEHNMYISSIFPTNATLYVPDGCLSIYSTNEYWNRSNRIIELKPEVNGIYYSFDKENMKAEVSALNVYEPYSYKKVVIPASNANNIVIPSSIIYEGETYSVTSIGESAFYDSDSLISIVIPNSVTSIGESTFFDCDSLISIIIPNSITSIGERAFYDCESLMSIIIPNSVTSIGNSAFYCCTGLASVTIPDSVTSIGNWAFRGCSSLTSIIIPNSVTSIGEGAFSGCSGLTSVTIPNSVTSIASGAFSGCSGLSSINVEEGNATYDSRNGCNAIIETATNTLILGCQNTIIPNSVTTIGSSAFSGCSGLTSITIPGSVTSIDGSAFSGCSGLTSVTIPNSVTSIGGSAFSGCSGLTSIDIPGSVTTIRIFAFSDCSGLKDVYCNAEKVQNAHSGVFFNTDISQATLHVPENLIEAYSAKSPWNQFGKIVPLGEEVEDDTYINGIYYNFSENSAEVVRGDNVYSGAVVIPDSVSYKGKTYGVVSIGESAFYRCQDLTSVSIPGSVNTIGEQAFLGCNKLTSINLPNGLTIIGGYAFCECSALTSVTIPNSVTHIGKSAFLGCFSLTSVALPNSVTDIGESVFSSCRSLTSINIPNSVTSISGNAFSYCTGLTSVTIGSNVTSIGNYAFAACESLKDVYCDAEKVPNAYSDTFFDTDVSQATLHVPGMCKEAYRTTSPWNQFGTIVSSSDEKPTITDMQLDNSSFDEWSIVDSSSGKDLYQPWGEGKTPYWDTYNTFATTFSVSNSTYADEDGRRYANLQTKYLVVKLVAGAIFTGSYLEVDGTNSVLSLGRPFTERPTKMKFDFQYHSSTINRTGGTWKDAWGDYVSQSVYESLKGQPDSCQIYIALGDWEPVDYVDKSGVTHTCPYLICTRPSQLHLFNPNDPHIIGYAQMTCGKDISSWTTETMDIHYRSDRTPKYIIVYATSSKYGDFSTGGEMSELKLDNIELLYGSIPDIDPEPVDSIPEDGGTFIEKLANGVEMEFKVISKEGKTCQVGSGTSHCIDTNTTGAISIPNEVRRLSVVAIGDNAFSQCNDLSSVTLPSSVTSIGQFTFKDCKLHNILIKCEMPPAIEENAFTNQTFYHAMLYIPTGSWDVYAYDDNWYRFINIRETAMAEEDISEQQAYMLMDAETFAYSVYDPVNDCIGTINSIGSINEDNPYHSWQMIRAGGMHFLYNLGAKKYVKRDADALCLTDEPEPIEIANGDNGLILAGQSGKRCVLVCNESLSFSQAAIDQVTGIDSLTPSRSKGEGEIYNLAGQLLSKPQKGINIIGSRKVLVK